eukprot:TRINITY_DN13368_c0_g1_i5.p1 TRINITY_DN13368_c0_g1~~TRINITY_DN13368_c0_g1_i5.p1  ORF type:complete len:157 (+),score=19.72 TRINITY_DN13368_c0_g1_i5:207-677(+)
MGLDEDKSVVPPVPYGPYHHDLYHFRRPHHGWGRVPAVDQVLSHEEFLDANSSNPRLYSYHGYPYTNRWLGHSLFPEATPEFFNYSYDEIQTMKQARARGYFNLSRAYYKDLDLLETHKARLAWSHAAVPREPAPAAQHENPVSYTHLTLPTKRIV